MTMSEIHSWAGNHEIVAQIAGSAEHIRDAMQVRTVTDYCYSIHPATESKVAVI